MDFSRLTVHFLPAVIVKTKETGHSNGNCIVPEFKCLKIDGNMYVQKYLKNLNLQTFLDIVLQIIKYFFLLTDNIVHTCNCER